MTVHDLAIPDEIRQLLRVTREDGVVVIQKHFALAPDLEALRTGELEESAIGRCALIF